MLRFIVGALTKLAAFAFLCVLGLALYLSFADSGGGLYGEFAESNEGSSATVQSSDEDGSVPGLIDSGGPRVASPFAGESIRSGGDSEASEAVEQSSSSDRITFPIIETPEEELDRFRKGDRDDDEGIQLKEDIGSEEESEPEAQLSSRTLVEPKNSSELPSSVTDRFTINKPVEDEEDRFTINKPVDEQSIDSDYGCAHPNMVTTGDPCAHENGSCQESALVSCGLISKIRDFFTP